MMFKQFLKLHASSLLSKYCVEITDSRFILPE